MIPSLTWQGNTPFSATFDDIYFNPENGLKESLHVFVSGNFLNERFANHRHFTIAELGFGTGLNLLAAWHCFLEHAPPDAILHYVSFERDPLSPDMLLKAATNWPSLQPLAQSLFPQLSLFGDGIYRIHAPRLILTLVIGDAHTSLPQMEFLADAWFLDGFAPAKNPEMWSESLLSEVGTHTKTGGTAATFTAAGAVKRSLNASGFHVQKVRGYGRKRDMIVAQKEGAAVNATPPAMVRIAGGGIAGCAAAYSLARRGINVELYEPSGIAAGASGNVAGALYPILHKQMSPAMHGYLDALRYLGPLLATLPAPYALCGMIKLPVDAEDEILLRSLPERLGLPPESLCWQEPEAASEIAGIRLQSGGLHLPRSGWVDVPALCRALIDHPQITLCPRALPPDEAPIPTLLANGTAATEWFAPLPLHSNRGQISLVDAAFVPYLPRCVLSHRGYAIGLPSGELMIGATYGRGDTDCTPRDTDHAENLALTQQFLPNLLKPEATITTGRASLRTVTPDRMPLMGQIAPHRYLSTGHGSRGILSAPIIAEWLADTLCQTPRPLRQDSARQWNVTRYPV